MANEKEEVKPVEAQPVEAKPAPAKVEETWEEKQQRLKQEDFVRRNAEAIKQRRLVLKANGLEDDTQEIDPAEVKKRCC